jgi:AmiR/NasT family two-component response regulator
MTEVPTRDGDVASLRGDAEMVRVAGVEAENAQLRHALESSNVIEQAKAAMSARMGTTPDVAFELLRGLARSQRRNLVEYAAEVVRNGGRLDV